MDMLARQGLKNIGQVKAYTIFLCQILKWFVTILTMFFTSTCRTHVEKCPMTKKYIYIYIGLFIHKYIGNKSIKNQSTPYFLEL